MRTAQGTSAATGRRRLCVRNLESGPIRRTMPSKSPSMRRRPSRARTDTRDALERLQGKPAVARRFLFGYKPDQPQARRAILVDRITDCVPPGVMGTPAELLGRVHHTIVETPRRKPFDTEGLRAAFSNSAGSCPPSLSVETGERARASCPSPRRAWNHPVCALQRCLRDIFLIAQPPLLTQGVITSQLTTSNQHFLNY